MELALTLLVARVLLADDANDTAPPDHLAVLADRLHARANLHVRLTPSKKYWKTEPGIVLSAKVGAFRIPTATLNPLPP
jgi:uncharacterized protein with von Willebrand factor type A (vWA) domain